MYQNVLLCFIMILFHQIQLCNDSKKNFSTINDIYFLLLFTQSNDPSVQGINLKHITISSFLCSECMRKNQCMIQILLFVIVLQFILVKYEHYEYIHSYRHLFLSKLLQIFLHLIGVFFYLYFCN